MPKYKVFYRLQPGFINSGTRDVPLLTISDIPKTHTFIRELDAKNLDDVFRQMQGEVWSPKGEAVPIIEASGAHHTSMSVGDVAQDKNGDYWECLDKGWRKVIKLRYAFFDNGSLALEDGEEGFTLFPDEVKLIYQAISKRLEKSESA